MPARKRMLCLRSINSAAQVPCSSNRPANPFHVLNLHPNVRSDNQQLQERTRELRLRTFAHTPAPTP